MHDFFNVSIAEWNCWLTTGPDANMATENDVTLVVYGDKKVSEPVLLGNGRIDDFFKESQEDQFQVSYYTFL